MIGPFILKQLDWLEISLIPISLSCINQIKS